MPWRQCTQCARAPSTTDCAAARSAAASTAAMPSPPAGAGVCERGECPAGRSGGQARCTTASVPCGRLRLRPGGDHNVQRVRRFRGVDPRRHGDPASRLVQRNIPFYSLDGVRGRTRQRGVQRRGCGAEAADGQRQEGAAARREGAALRQDARRRRQQRLHLLRRLRGDPTPHSRTASPGRPWSTTWQTRSSKPWKLEAASI